MEKIPETKAYQIHVKLHKALTDTVFHGLRYWLFALTVHLSIGVFLYNTPSERTQKSSWSKPPSNYIHWSLVNI